MSLRRHNDIDTGWAWVAAISVYLTMVINCTALYMAGVIYIALLDKYKEGKAKTSLVGALNSGLLCVLSPICGILINKFSCRTAILSGGIIATTGFAASAFIDSLDVTILTAGVLVGIGYSLTTAGIIVNLGYYFQKRRNFMISIIFVVVGVGMFLSAPVGLIIKDTYGLSSSFLILAGMYAQTCVLGMLCKPSSCERKFQEERRTRAKLSKDTLSSHFNFSLICNKPFLCFLISSCTWNFALVTALMHLPNYLKINGGTDSEIGWLMTAFAIANTFGRLGGSLCVRKESINTLTVHIVSIGIAGIITSLFPLYSTHIAGKYSFSILLGFLCGFPNVLMTTLSIRFVGVSMLPEANGLSYFFCGIGVSTGPIVTGYLLGLTGSYRYSFVLAGVVLIIGSLFGILASISLRNVRETDKEVTFVVDNTEPMLENKSDTDSYKHRPNDSVLRNDSEKKLEYCNGIEERNKLIQPMLDNKSHTDSYKLRPTDSVLRDNFERKLEYCNGIEEMNKLIQPTHFQCNGFGNYDSVH